MVKELRGRYDRARFSPGTLGIFVNPFYFAREGLIRHMRELGREVVGRTLDVGCGSKPYEYLCSASAYVGLEVATAKKRKLTRADVFYDGSRFPFPDRTFDSAIVNQVLEHVFTPETFLGEVQRVLKPDGRLVLTVPFVWDEHEQPWDYARYSSFGLRYLLERHGFEVLELRKSVNDVGVLFQLLNLYIYKKVYMRSAFVRLGCMALLQAPVNVLGCAIRRVLPLNSDLYLDNVVLARRR